MSDAQDTGLLAIHTRWALYAAKRMRLLHPELSLKLYAENWEFTLHAANCDPSGFPALAKFFYDAVRPITCNMKLSLTVPEAAIPLSETNAYEAELWLNGEPLPAPALNNLLFLAEPNLPHGGIDFDNARETWVFNSFDALTDDEKTTVRRAVDKVGIAGPVDWVQINPPTAPASDVSTIPKRQGDLTLITSRQIKHAPGTLRDLVHQDEDEWRGFLARRARQEIVVPDARSTSGFACLYDAEHCGESRLSELLTIYDRIDLMPERSGLAWAAKHQISLPDLQELVRLKRVRLVLPYSLADYPSTLIEAIAEVDRDSLVLSRALAAKTISRGQAKEPFLHAPLTSAQRAAVLSILSQSVKDDKGRALAGAYGRLFCGQHDMFMMRGALASLGFSAGAYLGDVFFNVGKKDARIELMTCGAGVEWALGLGVSYIPRDFEGYDETWNSHIIASYLSRTKARPVDPVANRMHIISDGLLGVSGVPPLEVAKNFHSLRVSRFRNLARRLMETTPDATELQGAVEQINADVKAFERRADRLAWWKLGLVLTEGIATVAHQQAGFWASVAAVWFYEKIKESETLKRVVPENVRNELSDAITMLTGLATASSLDAVIVSRSRKAIGGK